eukprot:5411500-Prymnesium_polylepis.1
MHDGARWLARVCRPDRDGVGHLEVTVLAPQEDALDVAEVGRLALHVHHDTLELGRGRVACLP